MVNEKIEPALTAEEWARVREDNIRDNVLEKIASGYYFYTSERNANGVYVPRSDEDHYAAMMALANSLLPDGHPLKITDQDIALLASRVRTMEPIKNHPGWIQEAAMWSALHAKLLALLPPDA
jgi:hypothetical protein